MAGFGSTAASIGHTEVCRWLSGRDTLRFQTEAEHHRTIPDWQRRFVEAIEEAERRAVEEAERQARAGWCPCPEVSDQGWGAPLHGHQPLLAGAWLRPAGWLHVWWRSPMFPVETASFLARTPLFRELTLAEVLDLVFALEEVSAPEGGLVFEEGAAGDAWYVIRSGRVEVQRSTADGLPHRLAELETGDCFGEMALLDGSPRTGSVVALERTALLRFPKSAFDRLVADGGTVATRVVLGLARVVTARQRELTWIVMDMVEDKADQPDPRHAALAKALWASLTMDGE